MNGFVNYMNPCFSEIIEFITTGKSDKMLVNPIVDNNLIIQMKKLLNRGSHFVAYYVTEENELQAIVSIFGVAFYKIKVCENLNDLNYLYKLSLQEFDLEKIHEVITYTTIDEMEKDFYNNFIIIKNNYLEIPFFVSNIENEGNILLSYLTYRIFKIKEKLYCKRDLYNFVKVNLEDLFFVIFLNKPTFKRFSKEYGEDNFEHINWENPDADFWLKMYICYLIGKSDIDSIDDKSFNKILYSNFDISTLRLTKQLAEEYRNNMKKDKKYLQVVIQGFEKINNWI